MEKTKLHKKDFVSIELFEQRRIGEKYIVSTDYRFENESIKKCEKIAIKEYIPQEGRSSVRFEDECISVDHKDTIKNLKNAINRKVPVELTTSDRVKYAIYKLDDLTFIVKEAGSSVKEFGTSFDIDDLFEDGIVLLTR